MPSADPEHLHRAAAGSPSATEVESAIARLVHLSVPRLANWCLVDLVTSDGGHYDRIAFGQAGDDEIARALARRYPLRRDYPGVAAAIVSGQPQLIPVIDEAMISRIELDREHGALLRAMRLKSGVIAPLVVQGRVIGALTFGANTRTYTEEDLKVVEPIALSIALAIDNARLLNAEQRGRQRMERLQQIVGALSCAATASDVAHVACRIATEVMEAASGSMWLTLPDGSLAMAGTWGSPKEFVDQFRVLRAGTPGVPALEVVRTGEPVWIECAEDYQRVAPQIFESVRKTRRLASFAALPIEVDGRVEGVITFAQPIGHRFDADQRAFYLAVARHCAGALERARLLDQARQTEERLRLALEAASIGTWDLDARTGELRADDRFRRTHGLTETEPLMPEAILERVHPDDREPLLHAVRCALDSQGSGELTREYRVAGAEGASQWVAVNGRALFEDGRAMRMLGTARDRTIARNAEAERAALLARERAARSEAEAANRLKDDFLANVSHELRAPLHAIAAWSARLSSTLDDRESLARGLDMIRRNVELQARLVEDVLDVSRIVAGTLQIEQRSIDLAAVVRDAVEIVRPAADDKHQRLVLHLADRAPTRGDAHRLQQAIGNVLANAVKFTDRGGELRVELSFDVETLSIAITDSGSGIDPEFLPYVFDRFRQADSSSTRRYGGLGLGLAIARHIIELHAGRIRADSEGRGRGATFTIELPSFAALAGDAIPGGDAQEPAVTGPRLDMLGCKILIVEDEQDVRDVLLDLLADLGAVVQATGSVAEAIAVFKRFAPDVIVSDISMPDEDGYALLRLVRERCVDTMPYTIALTAHARDQVRAQSVESKFDVHISKPVNVQALANAIGARPRPTRGAETDRSNVQHDDESG
jgi:PAS domain S-box-containing protein